MYKKKNKHHCMIKVTKVIEGTGINEKLILIRSKFREAIKKFGSFFGVLNKDNILLKRKMRSRKRERLKKHREQVKFGDRTRSCRKN